MKRNTNYIAQLKEAVSVYKSIICFGLDPVIDALHSRFSTNGIMGFFYMLEELFYHMNVQKVYPGAFKPNHGFYSIYGSSRNIVYGPDFIGLETLAKTMNLIESSFPKMPIILDYKRGDIGKSSANYAREGFGFWNADAVTISPYMGSDSMTPFLDYCDMQLEKTENRGVYVLNLTSNPGAKDFEMKKMENGSTLYMSVAEWIRNHAGQFPGLGAVVGAPDLTGLRNIAKFYADTDAKIPLLIPGVGGQGGKADEVVEALNSVGYNKNIARINVSSGLTHPWGEKVPAPDDWHKIIIEKLFEYNKLTGMA